MSNRLPIIVDEIKRAHDDARTAARFSAERAMEAGRLLIEAKASVGHGEWLPWLRVNVQMSERTARGYMTLAKSGLKSATVADLGLRASLARVARRKGPAFDLRAGTWLWLEAGERVQGADLFTPEPQPEHSLWLWSVDGQYAWKCQVSFDAHKRPNPWLCSVWKKPVRLDFIRRAILNDGFPLSDAQVVQRYEAQDPDELAAWKPEAGNIIAWFNELSATGQEPRAR